MASNLTINSYVVLNNGVKMPLLGLGTYMASGGKTIESAIKAAWDAGYRHIDTAAFYQNEREIGDALRKHNIPRDQVFITTKLWYSDHGYESTIAACNASLKRLGMDYVDLYLVHWPGTSHDSDRNPEIRRETWRAMQQLYKEGKCRAIGVSNYTVRHLKQLIEEGEGTPMVVPAVNQVEMHPLLTQKELMAHCKSKDIVMEAYSPFAKGKILKDKKLQAIADKYGKSIAQLIVRYFLQQNVVVIPKSITPERIRDNANVYDFEISEDDMKRIDAMNKDWHCTWDPTEVQ